MLKATNRKFTGSEKRQIKAVIRRARSGHGNRVSAQQTIPYQRMYPDGVCRVDVNRYNKTIQFQDINYQLSENEDKDAIFGSWCEFINYFDSSVSFEFSFLNLENGQSGGDDRIEMTARQDDFDGIREEYAQMLQNQLARGNNGLRKTKYLTFTIEADSVRNAKPRLERIEAELLGPPRSSSRTGARSESERSFAARRSCRLPPPTCPTVRWKRFWRWTAA